MISFTILLTFPTPNSPLPVTPLLKGRDHGWLDCRERQCLCASYHFMQILIFLIELSCRFNDVGGPSGKSSNTMYFHSRGEVDGKEHVAKPTSRGFKGNRLQHR